MTNEKVKIYVGYEKRRRLLKKARERTSKLTLSIATALSSTDLGSKQAKKDFKKFRAALEALAAMESSFINLVEGE